MGTLQTDKQDQQQQQVYVEDQQQQVFNAQLQQQQYALKMQQQKIMQQIEVNNQLTYELKQREVPVQDMSWVNQSTDFENYVVTQQPQQYVQVVQQAPQQIVYTQAPPSPPPARQIVTREVTPV